MGILTLGKHDKYGKDNIIIYMYLHVYQQVQVMVRDQPFDILGVVEGGSGGGAGILY